MVLAGLLLSRVQHWPVFAAHPELFTLVPALLGLKGNLEMTLASRLSTLANTGALDGNGGGGGGWRKVACANLALVQTQGIVVGMVAAAIPIAVSSMWSGKHVKFLLLMQQLLFFYSIRIAVTLPVRAPSSSPPAWPPPPSPASCSVSS